MTEQTTVVRSLTLEVIKPTNTSWDDFGSAVRYVYNGCLLGANQAQTAFLRADHEMFRKPQLDERGNIQIPKKGKKIDIPKIDEEMAKQIYHQIRERFPAISSRTVSFLIQEVRQKYQSDRFDVLRCAKASKTFRNFSFQQDQFTLRENEDGSVEAEILLLSEKSKESGLECPRRVKLLLNTRRIKSRDREILQSLIKNPDEKKALRFIYLARKKKWLISFAIERPIQKIDVDPNRVMHVYPPGKGVMLQCAFFAKSPAISIEDIWKVPIQYNDAIQYRKAYDRISKDISSSYRQSDMGGRLGHGLKRAIQAKSERQEKYRRACRTHNQQRAAFIIKQAIRWKCGKISYLPPTDVPIEGYNLLDSWPWYELEQCIKNKATESGIAFEKVAFKEEVFAGLVKEIENVLQPEAVAV